MERPVFRTHYNYEIEPGVVVPGISQFEPDLSLSITDIFERSLQLLQDSPYHLKEIPDEVDEYYDDYTTMLEPNNDNVDAEVE